MRDYGPGAQLEITEEEKQVWQKISDFIKIDRLEDDGLASGLEVDGFDLGKISVAVKMVERKPDIIITIGEVSAEGRAKLQEAIVNFVRMKISPEVEVKFQ
ncbi:hypothetical protein GYA13_00115 [Candidatus Kuenenbacteria bacterium]|nr:hypothetical protein [Candidatus Kuenenbacteria bacterium]